MEIAVLAAHITELEREFRTLARQVPGLAVGVVGRVSDDDTLVHPVAGFEVRLHHQDDGPGVALYISLNYAELKAWASPTSGVRRERFNVRLADEFAWGDTVFESASELAQRLLGYMQFNLDLIED